MGDWGTSHHITLHNNLPPHKHRNEGLGFITPNNTTSHPTTAHQSTTHYTHATIGGGGGRHTTLQNNLPAPRKHYNEGLGHITPHHMTSDQIKNIIPHHTNLHHITTAHTTLHYIILHWPTSHHHQTTSNAIASGRNALYIITPHLTNHQTSSHRITTH
jgi:hypothetical protein